MESNERENSRVVTDEELELINAYSRKMLSADDVYTFSVVLCDNDIDRDNEHFSDDALYKLSQLFVGVTGIYDHEPSAKNQVARIYKCEVEAVEDRKTAYGAPYKRICAKAYVPRCKSSEELITLLDSGIRKEVSVGCGIKRCICSICGGDLRTGACEHRKGRMYDGKLCCGVLDEPTDAYEWSFIAVPSQRNAGVIKSFFADEAGLDLSGEIRKQTMNRLELQSDDVAELKSYIAQLKAKAEEGEKYRSALVLEAVKAGITAKVGIDSSLLERMVKGLSVDELIRLKDGFEKTAARILPIRPQTAIDIDEGFGSSVNKDEMSGYII